MEHADDAPHGSGRRPTGTTALPLAPEDTQPEAGHDVAESADRVVESTPEEVLGPLVAGDMCGDRYEIIRKIGHGGMAVVYLAIDMTDNKGTLYAIKTLKPSESFTKESAKRFEAEIDSVREIVCENVVRFHHAGVEDGVVWFSMDYLPGETLAELIARRAGRLPRSELLYLAMQLAKALMSMHECGIVHRDLKPLNVMVDRFTHLTVIDFGVSKNNGGYTTTQRSAAPATPSYMSPEQGQGYRDVDGRSDIYNFGLILYELVSGRRALLEEGANVTMMQQIAIAANGNIEPFREHECDPALAALIYKALAREREERFQTAEELLVAIRTLIVEGRRRADHTVNTEERAVRQERKAHRLEKKALAEREVAREAARKAVGLPTHTMPLVTQWVAEPGQVKRRALTAHTMPMPKAGAEAEDQAAPAPVAPPQPSGPGWMAQKPAPRVAKTRSMMLNTEFQALKKTTDRKFWVVLTVMMGLLVLLLWRDMRRDTSQQAAPAATATPAVAKPAAEPTATAKAVATPEPTASALAVELEPTATAKAAASPVAVAPRPRQVRRAVPSTRRKPKPKPTLLGAGDGWFEGEGGERDMWGDLHKKKKSTGPPPIGGLDEEKPRKTRPSFGDFDSVKKPKKSGYIIHDDPPPESRDHGF